jgi:hypothetical protein
MVTCGWEDASSHRFVQSGSRFDAKQRDKLAVVETDRHAPKVLNIQQFTQQTVERRHETQ